MATSDEAWPERAPSDDDDDERRGGGDGDDDERRGGEASRPQSALRIDEARSIWAGAPPRLQTRRFSAPAAS